jgi:hypothetical protein
MLRVRKKVTAQYKLFGELTLDAKISAALHMPSPDSAANILFKKKRSEYTPISSLSDYHRGMLTLWIRVYPGGKLTSALERLLQSGAPV